MTEPNAINVKTIAVIAVEPLVLPDDFRRGLGLDAGGEFTIIQLDGIVLLTAKRLVSLNLLEQIREILDRDSISLDDLLEGLTQVRQEIYQERYGNRTAARL